VTRRSTQNPQKSGPSPSCGDRDRAEQAATIAGWRRRRLSYVAENRSRLIVGHEDVAAWSL
jgi:hypothetical protein